MKIERIMNRGSHIDDEMNLHMIQLSFETHELDAIADRVLERVAPLITEKGSDTYETIYTVETLAAYLQVSEQWVYERVQLKEIPYSKIGKLLRFKKKAIDRWLDEQTTPAVNPLTRRLKVVRRTE